MTKNNETYHQNITVLLYLDTHAWNASSHHLNFNHAGHCLSHPANSSKKHFCQLPRPRTTLDRFMVFTKVPDIRGIGFGYYYSTYAFIFYLASCFFDSFPHRNFGQVLSTVSNSFQGRKQWALFCQLRMFPLSTWSIAKYNFRTKSIIWRIQPQILPASPRRAC